MALEDIATSFADLDPGDDSGFDRLAKEAFEWQRARNPVYRRYCRDAGWTRWDNVPFLPVAAFKEADVATFPVEESERVFYSSATGSSGRSRHFVRSLDVYRRSFETHFVRIFGSGPFTFVAHLPHYAEVAATSSLVYMVDALIRSQGDEHSGFFLEDVDVLHRAAAFSRDTGSRLILFGAAFGLLDLLDHHAVRLPAHATVIETGGMKMRRREIDREALHRRLAEGLRIPAERVYSEYGMCELMSQCYTRGEEVLYPPPWMRFRVVDPSDPSRDVPAGVPGALAFFDLANLYSVSAVLTEDRGIDRGDGFEVVGRLTGSELRGCNFLMTDAGLSGRTL